MVKIEIECGPNTTQLVRAVVPCKGMTGWTIDNVPAQVEVVTLNQDNKPDTVELIALVPNKAPNGRATYIAMPGVTSVPTDNTPIAGWPALRVDFIDNKFNVYTFSAGQSIIQEGFYKSTQKITGTLQRVDGFKIVCVTICVTRYRNQPWYEFDFDFNNGLLVGDIEFHSLSVSFGDGFMAYPMTGSLRPCSQTDGSRHYIAKPGNHFWPKQGPLQRRFIVTKPLSLTRKYLEYLRGFGTIGFCLDWTDSFGPTKTGIGLPTNSMKIWGSNNKQYVGREAQRRLAEENMSALKYCLEQGLKNENRGIYTTPYGPFHPYHINMQGAHGGFGIIHYSGESLCLEDYVANVCIAHMVSERQNWVMMTPEGKIKDTAYFVSAGNGVIQFDFAPYDWDINGVPEYINLPPFSVGNANKELKSWPPFDAQHQSRFNKPWQALAFLGNDLLAKRAMQISAEINLLYLNNEKQLPGWGDAHNLKGMLEKATAKPRQGGLMGRAQCWPVDAIMAYHAIAEPKWRSNNMAWVGAMTSMMMLSQMPTGWNNRVDPDWKTQVTETAQLPIQYDVGQTFEIEFEDWAKRCLAVALPISDRLRIALNKSIIKSATSFFKSAIYKNGSYRWYIAVAKNGGAPLAPTELTYALTAGGGEVFYGWYILNHAHLASKELNDKSIKWLDVALTYRQTVTSYTAKRDQISLLASESWNNHMPQAVGLMCSLQG